MNGLRLASGVVVLPLLVLKLPKPDYDIYFVFLSLSALVPILDLGFAVSVGRAVSYAMGGATELKPMGFAPQPGAAGPNRLLLWQLLHTTRQLYRLLSAGTLLLVGLGGTAFLSEAVPQTSAPVVTWTAWGVTLAAMVWEIYAGWWNVFLRNMDRVLESTRQIALGQAVKIALSAGLLLAGAGLLSVPVAGIVASFLQRSLARRAVLAWLGEPPAGVTRHIKQFVATLWPNSWRVGVHFLSGYLAGQANTLVCLPLLGLAASGRYGFSLQLVAICSGMAQVWTLVKWPQVGQLRIKQDQAALRRLLWPRLWLQYLTYAVLVTGAVVGVPALLQAHHSEKSLLPPLWFALLAVNGWLDMNCSFWNTLISTENRLPMVWPMLAGNVASLLLTIVLVKTTSLDLGAFILAPLAVGLLYNHWKWPREGARTLGTTWWRFLFSRPG